MSDRKVLVVLSNEDKAAITSALQAVASQQRTLELMNRGYNALWAGMRNTYDLPAEFEFDLQSGIIYEKKDKPFVPTADTSVKEGVNNG